MPRIKMPAPTPYQWFPTWEEYHTVGWTVWFHYELLYSALVVYSMIMSFALGLLMGLALA
jgi:hypothetical protein